MSNHINLLIQKKQILYLELHTVIGSIAYVLWGFICSQVDQEYYDGALLRSKAAIFGPAFIIILRIGHFQNSIKIVIFNLYGYLITFHFLYIMLNNPADIIYISGLFVAIMGVVSALMSIYELTCYSLVVLVSSWFVLHYHSLPNTPIILLMEISIFFYFLMGHYYRRWFTEIAKQGVKQKEALISISAQAAHDIRSPLSALNLLIGSSSFHSVPDSEKQIIQSASNRIHYISNDLLETNKIYRNLSVEFTKFDLVSAVKEIIDEKKVIFNKIAFNFSSNTDKFLFNGDKSNFQRALSNLLNNSYEANSYNCHIRLSILRLASSSFEIIISDNGNGIPPQVVSSLGLTSGITTKTFGTGLGLHGSFILLNSMNITMQIADTSKAGTSIKLIHEKDSDESHS